MSIYFLPKTVVKEQDKKSEELSFSKVENKEKISFAQVD